MTVPTTRVVVTAAVHDWLEDDVLRTVWIGGCLARHRSGDWGDLDLEDRALNDQALTLGLGRVMSSYRLPDELIGTTAETRVWVITDDLDDPDTATTVLWPSDY